MDIRYRIGSEDVHVIADPEADGWRIRLPDGSHKSITAQRLEGDVLRIGVGDCKLEIPFALNGKNVLVSYQGNTYEFSPAGGVAAKASQSEEKSGVISAPMVGTVTDLFVRDGENVAAYQPLAAVEAMKVLVTLEAPFAGTVRKLSVKKGDRIEHGAIIMEISPG